MGTIWVPGGAFVEWHGQRSVSRDIRQVPKCMHPSCEVLAGTLRTESGKENHLDARREI